MEWGHSPKSKKNPCCVIHHRVLDFEDSRLDKKTIAKIIFLPPLLKWWLKKVIHRNYILKLVFFNCLHFQICLRWGMVEEQPLKLGKIPIFCVIPHSDGLDIGLEPITPLENVSPPGGSKRQTAEKKLILKTYKPLMFISVCCIRFSLSPFF